MYQNILRQIVNTIFINIHHHNSLGLLDGKTGISIFLYEYANYVNNRMYNNLAGELIDQVYEKLDKNIDKKFYNGLAGIAYGIDYVVKNKFVETNKDEEDILTEIDTKLSQMDENAFLLELDSKLPLFSKGLYFLQRKDKYSLSKIAEECLLFLTLHIHNIPLSYLSSILYFINKASKTINKNTLNKISDTLLMQTSKLLSEHNYNKSDIYTLNWNIKNIPELEIKNKWTELLTNHNNEDIFLSDKSWIHFIYKYDNNKDISIDDFDIQKQLSYTVQNLTHEDLNLYNGLAGLGLELIRLSKK